MRIHHPAFDLLLATVSIVFPSYGTAQQNPGKRSSSTVTTCHLRLQGLAGSESHLDQLKREALPDVIREIDDCVASGQLSRVDLVNGYKARSNVQQEFDRRASQEDEGYRAGVDSCLTDLRPAAEQLLKPVGSRFVDTSDESLQKQQNRAMECNKSFGRDDKARMAAAWAYDAVQVERFYRIALRLDKSSRDLADRYNADTAQLWNRLSVLRQQYIDHLDRDVLMYKQMQKRQRAEEWAEALAAWSRAISSTPSPAAQTFQPPKSVHCTTQTIPPAVPGMSSWAYTSCY